MLFPEKRSFFLQGAGVFGFASTGPEPAGGIPPAGADVYPFFSRQIGLLNGVEVPIDAGIKLTGTVGRTDVGLLDVRTGDLPIVSEKNFLVGRVKRNLFQQSYVGAIFTDGHPAQGESGQTYGADMRLATSRFLGRPNNLVVNAYGTRSVNKGVSSRDWSYGFSAHYPNDRFNAQVAFREIQENFKPALGFVQRDNVRMLRLAASYNPRPKDFLNVLQMFHDIYYTRFTRLDYGQVESWDLYVTLLDWHLKSGDNLHGMFDFNPTYERLFEPFEISPGVFLLPGEYRFTRFRSNLLSTATKRRLSGSINLTYGNYWSGKAEQVTTSLTYKLPPRFTISAEHEPDVCATSGRSLHRPHLHVQRQLRGIPVAVAVESGSVRQPVQEPGLAESRALDAATRQRPVLRVQPGVDPGGWRRHPPFQAAGQQDIREVSVLVSLLNVSKVARLGTRDSGPRDPGSRDPGSG